MEQVNPEILAAARDFIDQVMLFARSLILPSRLWQVALVVAIFGLAALIRHFGEPRVETFLRGLEGVPMARMRLYVMLKNRIRGLSFVVLAWTAVAVLNQVTRFPSQRFVVVTAATVGLAWVAIGLATRMIRNVFIRRVIAWAGWIYATLQLTGFLGAAKNILDTIALSFGDIRISLLTALAAVVWTVVLVTAARLTIQTIARRMSRNEELSPSVSVLVVKLAQVVLYGLAAYLGLKTLGFDLTGLAFLSGAIGVGLGFGLQKIVSNLVSGVIILLDESIKPGDVISLGDTFGWIGVLGARYVSVVTRDGKEYLIPNEDLITGQVVNWSHSSNFVRLEIEFGISYHDDPHKVRQVAADAARGLRRVLSDPAPVCHVTGFGDSSVNYILRFWINDPREGLTNVRGQVFLAMWDAFKREGFSIPFPQREVRLLNDTPAPGSAPGIPTAG